LEVLERFHRHARWAGEPTYRQGIQMKFSAFVAGLLAAGVLFQTAASAQGRIYKYCLEQGSPGSFPLMTCYYETMEQCIASKTGPADRCMINPQWPGRRQ
jgi:hypothetical protein